MYSFGIDAINHVLGAFIVGCGDLNVCELVFLFQALQCVRIDTINHVLNDFTVGYGDLDVHELVFLLQTLQFV